MNIDCPFRTTTILLGLLAVPALRYDAPMRDSSKSAPPNPFSLAPADSGCCDSSDCCSPVVDRRSFFRLAGVSATVAAVFQPASAQVNQPQTASASGSTQTIMADPTWPTLRHYDAEHIDRVAMPLGGVGAGSISLKGNGALRDWEVANRPAKGFTPQVSGGAPFFALWCDNGERKETRVLEGPLPLEAYEGSHGSQDPTHQLPRFEKADFYAAWPLGRLELSDPGSALSVSLRAFSPFIPTDAESSGFPVVSLRYRITNRSSKAMRVSVCGTLPNFIGMDGWETERDWKGARYPTGAKQNRNTWRSTDGLGGVFLDSTGVDPKAEAWGNLALCLIDPVAPSYRLHWTRDQWGGAILDFWDDLLADGRLDDRPDHQENAPVASVAAEPRELEPGASTEFSFLVAWHFPNRYCWNVPEEKRTDEDRIGNYYTTPATDAWEAARKVASQFASLEKRTVRFVSEFLQSSLPAVVKEAALFNASTLVTQTSFRTPDGIFYGWEGTADSKGCCHGSCTHVWNYEQTTAFLFGDIAWSMREVEFGHATDSAGLMSFRVHLPLQRAQQFGRAAADGQMGCIMKVYRDWHLSGNDAALRQLWPAVRRSLEFCWIPGGWDANKDGVMEGAQHNTMDVEYYGPNPQMGFWYLGALRATEEMARYLGESEFAATCYSLYEGGRSWMDQHLFNGEYYIQIVQPPTDASQVSPKLLVGMGAKDPTHPEFQLAAGCLVDQLVGQYMAHLCGLGYLADPKHIEATLRAILKYNYRETLDGHFNSMRSFALGNEKVLLMASYPKDRPSQPFPYWSEVMTGFEYTAAVGMLQEGMTSEGLACIENIRDRYDGRKRSPFDEAECGHHYARAMAAWAAIPALTGFHYSAVTHTMKFAAKNGRHFWSTGYAYGACRISLDGKWARVQLTVTEGTVGLRLLQLKGYGDGELPTMHMLREGANVELDVPLLVG